MRNRLMSLCSFALLLLAGLPAAAQTPPATPEDSPPQPSPEDRPAADSSATPGNSATPGTSATPVASPDVPEGWLLVWSDEFDGDSIDPANWTFDIGGGGWGNNEWQFYTDRPKNARVEDGMLIIEAHKENYQGRIYTSARLKTEGLQAWTYGRMEARIQVPYGQGIWPAFWSLGANFSEDGWPDAGEIDFMEHIGREPNSVHGAVHAPGYSGEEGVNASHEMDAPLHEDFHIFAVEWSAEAIVWYVDGLEYHRVTPQSLPGDWIFDHPFFLLLNVAVGGNWPGYPDRSTVFPQQMRVDYVRVYQQE